MVKIQAKLASADGKFPLCGGVIARFDAEIFLSAGRCAPCHEALTEN